MKRKNKRFPKTFTRKYNGKIYYHIATAFNKITAKKIVKRERKRGYSARIATFKDGYRIYHRRKKGEK